MQTTQQKTVRKIRDLHAEIRTMRRNLRLGRYQGRNSGGDTSWKERDVAELMADLPRDLQGLLTAEHRLALRISVNCDAGHARPELRARLAEDRRRIKELVK